MLPHFTSSNFVTRPSQYKGWTDENMARALELVHNKKMSVREAAIRFNVPKSTLGDRTSGRIQHGSVSGPKKGSLESVDWTTGLD